MAAALASSLVDLLLGSQAGSIDPEAGNRFSLDGLTWGTQPDGTLAFAIRRCEANSLRIAFGPLVVELGRLALQQVTGQLRLAAGRPHLVALDAATAELAGGKVHGPLALPPPSHPAATPAGPAAAGAWSLAPLATADGTLRAEIVDAHLVFDAQVTVPIRQGQVDFNTATVEHVGPDSRMGVSRLGLYVDAPNGRSYLYQFPSAPVAGVQYERRGALPGPWNTERGSLALQPFAEALLRQARGAQGAGFTEQSRLLFDRTAVSGELQLGDGRFAAPGVQAELAGRAEGRNALRVHSEAVGRGLAVDLAALSVRNAVWSAGATQLAADLLAGTLALRFFVEGGNLRFAFDLATLTASGLHLRLQPPQA